MRKKIGAILLLVTMIFSLCACGAKTVQLGEAVEKGVGRMTITDVQLADTSYVNGNTKDSDFLAPVNKDELDVGDSFIKSTDEDDGVVVITMVLENVGKSDWNEYPFNYVVNYDDGNEYSSENCYVQNDDGEWTEFDKVTLEKVTSGAVEVRIAVWVPSVIINDTKSLSLDFHGFTYQIR